MGHVLKKNKLKSDSLKIQAIMRIQDQKFWKVLSVKITWYCSLTVQVYSLTI